ncbi:hypothetical protein VKT23_009452 [Stygiomarasmius scandens]|uniref:Uncharacterized protein n=1 Tax=Marasmiellus scandens TaxID=2682957 RepID=A0ABR1JDT0_9AGAR
MALKEEDVGPALNMMRAQEQEDLAVAHSNAQVYSSALGQTSFPTTTTPPRVNSPTVTKPSLPPRPSTAPFPLPPVTVKPWQ